MNLKDIYNYTDNPLFDEDIFNKILIAYSNPNGMYAGLERASGRNYSNYYDKENHTYKGKFNSHDKDIFYAKVTNMWLDNLKKMSFDDLNIYIDKEDVHIFRQSYITYSNYVHNKEESDKLLKGEFENDLVRNCLEKFRWDSSKFGTWEFVTKRRITSCQINYPRVENRLYINPDPEDLYEFMNYFIDKCEGENINYSFKFDTYFPRDDNFVIYTSTEDITKYLKVLNEIKEEHPSLVSRFGKPPILTGKLDGWIGVGSEPVELNKDKNIYSFNSLRESRVLTPAIKDVTAKWLKDNLDTVLYWDLDSVDNNCKVTIKDIVSNFIVDDIVETLKYNIRNKSTLEAIESDGICNYDLNSSSVLNDIHKIVSKRVRNNLEKYANGGINSVESITLPLRNNIKYDFFPFAFERVIRKIPQVISKYDKNYNNDLKTQIFKNSLDYNINVDTFFLDNYSYYLMKDIDYNNQKKERSIKNTEELNNMFEEKSDDNYIQKNKSF